MERFAGMIIILTVISAAGVCMGASLMRGGFIPWVIVLVVSAATYISGMICLEMIVAKIEKKEKANGA